MQDRMANRVAVAETIEVHRPGRGILLDLHLADTLSGNAPAAIHLPIVFHRRIDKTALAAYGCD